MDLTRGFRLVWAECPYVQFEHSCSCTQSLQQGLQTGERGRGVPRSLVVRAYARVCVVDSSVPRAWGTPYPFIVQGELGLGYKKDGKVKGKEL